jgi:SRSO17 transposase
MIEWLVTEPDQIKYWFSILSRRISLRKLVYASKGRWPVERDYEELKDAGLGDYEVRGWRGFHHHATLCVAAYAFLVAERGLFSPSEIASHRDARAIACPEVDDPAVPPIRPEQHNPTSIATMQVEAGVAMAKFSVFGLKKS